MVSKKKGGFNFLPKPLWVVHILRWQDEVGRWSKNAHIQGENFPHRCRKANKKGQNYTHIHSDWYNSEAYLILYISLIFSLVLFEKKKSKSKFDSTILENWVFDWSETYWHVCWESLGTIHLRRRQFLTTSPLKIACHKKAGL